MVNSTNWQEKFLASLDEQEALEARVSVQSDLLRRLIIYLGAAASGLDPELDAAVLNLKDKVKGASGSVVHDQMLRVERIVRQFEEKRANYHQQNIQAITAITNNLSQLRLPSEFLTQLGDFKRQAAKSTFTLPLVPEQLSALARLHAQAIVASKEPDQGFWQRLKGGHQLQFEEQEPITGGDGKYEADDLPDSVIDNQQDPIQRDITSDIDIGEQDLDQLGWEAVNEEIKIVLDDILSSFKTNEQSSPVWQGAKMRLTQSMDWHQLVETLEDLRDILDERDEKLEHGISDYLTQVNEELHEICKRLGVSVEAEHKQEVAVDALGKAVTEQVEQMQFMVENSTDLAGLKSDISQHITVIGDALNEFKEKSLETRPISEELQELIKKVETIETESERTRQLLAQEQHRASHDALTELPNRDSYNHRVLQEWHRFKRYGRPLCIAVCDIDNFKNFNDSFGHQIGDRVLRIIAKSLQKRLRSVDFVARYGGEEFAVLLPETNLENAYKVLDSARAAIGEASFRFKDEPVHITFSCGVTVFHPEDTTATAFARADQGLYKAKEEGRNKTVKVD